MKVQVQRKNLRQVNLKLQKECTKLPQLNLKVQTKCTNLRQHNVKVQTQRTNLRQHNLKLQMQRMNLREHNLKLQTECTNTQMAFEKNGDSRGWRGMGGREGKQTANMAFLNAGGGLITNFLLLDKFIL